MTSLEFVEKEIDATKKQLAKYPLSKEQSDPNYKNYIHKEADIQYIHNKYYTERLQALQQIKHELEAWEVVQGTIVEGQDGDGHYCYIETVYFTGEKGKKVTKGLYNDETR